MFCLCLLLMQQCRTAHAVQQFWCIRNFSVQLTSSFSNVTGTSRRRNSECFGHACYTMLNLAYGFSTCFYSAGNCNVCRLPIAFGLKSTAFISCSCIA
uniref:Putative secreted protein n=1 Tax=Ixodes ricinus TaxID=34613 RepID=A0A6B0UDT1_IXORI